MLQPSKVDSGRVGRGVILIVILLLIFGVAGSSVFYRFLDRKDYSRDHWPKADASIVEVETMRETFRGKGPIMYTGRYKVQFSSGNQHCLTWVGSGVLEQDESRAKLTLLRTGDLVEVRFKPTDCSMAELFRDSSIQDKRPEP